MSDGGNGGPQSPSSEKNDAVGEVRAVHSTSGGDIAGRLGYDTVGSTEEAARVSFLDADRSVETSVPDNMNESMVSKVENEVGDGSGGALENQASSSVSRGHDNGNKKTDSLNDKSEHRQVKSSVPDYDSMLSEFDQFAAKGVGEAVGYGYEIGDMVWGKVKSHPWWPGHIYNEAFASPSVRRTKHEGHVLVAFFGDGSYGWFDPAELIPFEENFAEKSRQTSSRSFLKAVEEAVDELSRRRSSGLACRCRNKFNFWPSNVEGYYVVDVGDYEPGVYSLSQIKKARENFRPKEMLSFVQQLALAPMTDQHWTIEFLKNKATVLACRKALFEEFDETYAQAFGTVPVRPPRPTAPVTVDPSKAPLSGRQVFAETLGKGKQSGRPTKTKDQLEKDKYLFKRRDEPIHTKAKKTSSGQVGRPAYPLLVDGSGLSGILLDSGIKGQVPQSPLPFSTDSQHQPANYQTSILSDSKPTEGSRKLVEGGIKKAKVHKRQAGEFSAENTTLVQKKKRKKETNTEQPAGELGAENVILVEKKKKKKRKEIKSKASADLVQFPLVNSNSGAAVESTSGMLHDVPLSTTANSQLENQKDGVVTSSSYPAETQQAVDYRKLELPMLVRDLRALALNPFHGVERGCPATTQMVFLKYRSLVYQKSLVIPSPENEGNDARATKLPASTALSGTADKSNDKSSMTSMKPSVRTDDLTKGGKKRGPSDQPEAIKKKKLDNSEDINKKKQPADSEDIKKKKKIIQDSKSVSMEKKIPQRSTESQRGDTKEIPAKNVPPTLPKVVKLDSSKRNNQPPRVHSPTMLVMKFPQGAALPSGAELRAKFARFGPLDHSATRVFWKSYTCRLVFRQKVDAQAALTFALGSSNLFGNNNVRCYIKAVESEPVEAEPVKAQLPDVSAPTAPQLRGTTIEHRTPSKLPVLPLQPSVQLKSCLKKPSAEEGSNGNGRGTRVKFILGGEGSSNIKTEQLVSSSFTEVPSSSYTTHSMDISSKNSPKFIPQSNVPTTTTAHTQHHLQFQKYPIDTPIATAQQMPTNDISQQLLNLLTRCSDVVNNLTGVLGYVPYHPL
ncbi:Histone-lysine N-methyltransferase [Handroanthus impetiginosus]|uniref:Histone-lysine N-methyltransferase n=1 Tax=Handroanthus impetiginosus TaxID=429701 RepID=A0A2G9IB67_9LAMI|nr:Histone-lysine N-methyltransferase [Handroanthus impetiginosus]